MTLLEKALHNPDVGRTGTPHTAPRKHSGCFSFDEPGLIQEMLERLGPAIYDPETAQYIAHFLRVSDAVDGAGLESLLPIKRPKFSSDQLGEKHSYFGFKDAHATQEALRLLGPGIADEALSGYYEHYLA